MEQSGMTVIGRVEQFGVETELQRDRKAALLEERRRLHSCRACRSGYSALDLRQR